jgi:hypothetical protein
LIEGEPMRIRVVKPKPLSRDEQTKKPASEAQMTLAVQSWVKEFKSSKETRRAKNIWQSQKA